MPRLRPFPGIRYTDVSSLSELVCPPYDVISPADEARLQDLHPHNAVRVELAQSKREGERDYGAVAQTFRSWLEEGVLREDEQPSFYVYRQDFPTPEGERRRVAGVLGALELEALGGDSGVLPHERTMEGPKRDRLALLEAVQVNISPIYAIYRGGGGLAPYYDSLEGRPPAARFQDEDGTLHRLWVVTAPGELAMLEDALRPGPLVIADGHHRYETALAFKDAAPSAAGGRDSILCFCVDADAEDLVVLPYNRALRSAQAEDVTRRRLEARGARPVTAVEDGFLGERGRDSHPFIFVLPREELAVTIDDDAVVEAVGRRSPAWRALDVVALHEALLPEVFDDVEEVSFSKDPHEIRRLIGEEGWAAGVLLRALQATDVVEVARSGERMPQKASYFWPKAITGLVFRSLRG